mgnify:CR=1 FL=1
MRRCFFSKTFHLFSWIHRFRRVDTDKTNLFLFPIDDNHDCIAINDSFDTSRTGARRFNTHQFNVRRYYFPLLFGKILREGSDGGDECYK